MAKEAKLASFDDFSEENLLNDEDSEDKETIKDDDKEDEVKDQDDPKDKDDQDDKPDLKDKKKIDKKKVEEPKKSEKKIEKEKVEIEDKDKVALDDEKESEDDKPDPEVATKFFEEVQKITGLEVEVDYKDVDPLSPQGVALRDQAIKEVVLDDFLVEIEEKFPAVYRALKYANDGGDPAELFTQTKTRDYSKVELKDGDDALAKQILTEYYQIRGVKSDQKLAKLLEADEDSTTGLVGEAKSALEELKADQEEERQEASKEQELRAEERRKKDRVVVAAIDEALESKQLGSFRLTDRTEAAEFRKFVIGNLSRTADGYQLTSDLDEKNIARALQFQYFQFKNGDLSKIIQQKVGTEKARDLKLRLSQDQTKTKKTTVSEDTGKRSPSLQDY